MLLVKLLALLLVAILLAGCNHKHFHTPPERFPGRNGNSNHLLTIQFNDHGDLWDEAGYQNALALIRETRAQSPTGRVIVVTYVHGWKHNADAADTDYQHFRTLLGRMAVAPERKSPLIGIYIGWRGSSFPVPILENLTFWSRHGAAKRVAGIRMTEVLSQLMHATKAAGNASRFVIIGHSFGGRVVETVLAQSLVGVLVDNEMEPGRNPAAPFDLAILLNTASEARQTFQFIEALHSVGLQSGPQEPPLVLGITSRADWATGAVFPVGRFFPTLGSALLGGMRRDREAEAGGILETASNGDRYPGQFYQSMWTAGHMWFMRSHELVVDPQDAGRVRIQPLAKGEDGRPAQPWNKTPYWVIHEPKGDIIRDHNDIWRDPRLVACLEGYIAGALEGAQPRRLQMRPIAETKH